MSGAVASAPSVTRVPEWVAGAVVAVLAHLAVFGAASLAPLPEVVEAEAKAAQAVEETEGCTSVMTPSCVGDPVEVTQTAVPEPERSADLAPPRSRRCPEPMRRIMRYEHEPAPATEVDLLEAELVVAKGVETGKAQVQAKPAATRHKRVEQVRKLVAGGSKLDSILGGGEKGARRRSKLGAILGKSTGKKGGRGLVSRKGSAYARELKTTVLGHFTVPGNVPPWLRKSLRCRVRITRMTATGRVLSYRVEKKSGNDAFDKAVRRLMNGYKAGIRSLPAPPSHLLTAINSRGFVIDFR